MKLEGKFTYKKALILTPERIKELETVLLKYCENVSYEATTVIDTEISFSSMNEMLNYDNFQKRKLKEVIIVGRNGYEKIVNCVFAVSGFPLFKGYNETCLCKYIVSDVDKETMLRNDIQVFLKKATASYWLLGKFRLFGLLSFVSFYLFLFLLFGGNSNVKLTTIPLFFVSLLIGFCLVKVIQLIDCFLGKIFPPIVYLWGEEKENYEKYDKLRHNIFWCVFICMIVSIVCGIIVSYITTP